MIRILVAPAKPVRIQAGKRSFRGQVVTGRVAAAFPSSFDSSLLSHPHYRPRTCDAVSSPWPAAVSRGDGSGNGDTHNTQWHGGDLFVSIPSNLATSLCFWHL